MNEKFNAGLHRFAILLACMTVALLVAGALVTSNEAGDSVPDWPLSFGRWLIPSSNFIANVRFEYSHRFVAGVVGVTTLLFGVWAHLGERGVWVKRLALIALGGVLAQAVIGGLRVLFPEHKALIAVPHAVIAQSFFAVIVSVAVFTSRSWLERRAAEPEGGRPSLRKLSVVTLAAVLVQLVLGAGFRHQAFGIIPHLAGAAAVAFLIIWTTVIVIRRHGPDAFLTRPAAAGLILLVIQVCLGMAAYFARVASLNDPQPIEPMISLTVAHLVVGALTLASALVLALRCHRVLAPRHETVAALSESGRFSSATGAAV